MSSKTVLFAFLLFVSGALAQNNNASSGYLVRVERTTQYESVCALVSTDGSFRLEETHDKRAFTGMIFGEALASLKKTAEDPALAAMSLGQIETPLIEASSFEYVRISVARENGWQDLKFRGADSSKPVKDQVEALTDFLKNLRKGPKARLPDGDANGCIPQVAAAPVRVSATSSVASAVRSPSAQMVMWMRMKHIGDDMRSFAIRAERSCLLVADDGSYRYEKASQLGGGKAEGKAYQGMLPPESLEQLRVLLASPEIANAQTGEMPSTMTYSGDLDGTDVDIVRTDGHQILHTDVVSGVSRKDGKKELGMAYRNFAYGPIKELKPLVSWFKKVEKRKHEQALANAVLNDCKTLELRVQ